MPTQAATKPAAENGTAVHLILQGKGGAAGAKELCRALRFALALGRDLAPGTEDQDEDEDEDSEDDLGEVD